jgi:hypothetical protein
LGCIGHDEREDGIFRPSIKVELVVDPIAKHQSYLKGLGLGLDLESLAGMEIESMVNLIFNV